MKRARTTNFSAEEELLLVEEIKKHGAIENKTTNKFSHREREQAWEQVLLSYNAKSSRPREMEQIKSKFDNLKTKARKHANEKKNNLTGTGGGPAVLKTDDPVLTVVLEILNPKSVVGYTPLTDSDCDNVCTLPLIENEGINNDGNIEESIELLQPVEIEVIQPSSSNCEATTSYSRLQLATEATASYIVVDEKMETGIKKRDWSNYTPKKLKEPVNKKLRRTIPNTTLQAKEEYYKKKIEFLHVQEEEFERTQVRNSEKHVKEMELLNLEIELKKQLLHKQKDLE